MEFKKGAERFFNCHWMYSSSSITT